MFQLSTSAACSALCYSNYCCCCYRRTILYCVDTDSCISLSLYWVSLTQKVNKMRFISSPFIPYATLHRRQNAEQKKKMKKKKLFFFALLRLFIVGFVCDFTPCCRSSHRWICRKCVDSMYCHRLANGDRRQRRRRWIEEKREKKIANWIKWKEVNG